MSSRKSGRAGRNWNMNPSNLISENLLLLFILYHIFSKIAAM